MKLCMPSLSAAMLALLTVVATVTRPTVASSSSSCNRVVASSAAFSTASSISPTVISEEAAVCRCRGGSAGGAGERYRTGEVAAPSLQSVSLFGPEEKELDRYAAALAGTHFLRQERDKVIKDTTNPIAHLYLSMTKRGQHNRWMSSPWVSDKARQAQKNYLVQAGNIIRSNGLTTARYNELSHILAKKKDLRERVQQQAYLYRVNADLRGDKIRPLLDLSDDPIPRGGKGPQVGDTRQVSSQTVSKTMLFAKSLREVEALRLRQRKRLMKELGCDELPRDLCGPSMGKVSPRFRKACERFPLGAEKIVRVNGLTTSEFNRLVARTHGNPFYRWRVLRCVNKLSRAT